MSGMGSSKTKGGMICLSLLIFFVLYPIRATSGESLQSANESVANPILKDHLRAIRDRGTLVMLAFPHQLSAFVRVNLERGPMPKLGPSGHFLGIDVEIMEGFADYLGVKLFVRRVSEPSYAALIPDLLAGAGDLIASSLSITEEREEQVAFSDPYYRNYLVVVTPEDSSIESLADLRGRLGAVIPGSSQEEYLRQLGLTRDWFFNVSFRAEGYYAVEDGQADYSLVDANSAKAVLPTTAGLKVAFRLPGDDAYGFALPPGSNLLEPLNLYLGNLERSGRLATIIARHEAADSGDAEGDREQ